MAFATALHHWKIKSDGFQVISPMVSPECSNELREANNRLMKGSAKGYRLLGGLTNQVMEPNLDDPVYEANEAIEVGPLRSIELGWSEPVKTYSQLLFKPSHHPMKHPGIKILLISNIPSPARRLSLPKTSAFNSGCR